MTENTWGGKREGAGRKSMNSKQVLVRMTQEQHEAFKKLGGSAWLQKTVEQQKDLAGKLIVFSMDFDNLELMTQEQVNELEASYEDRWHWDEYGEYVFYSIKDVVEFVSEQINSEFLECEEPDESKIMRMADLLKDLSKLM